MPSRKSVFRHFALAAIPLALLAGACGGGDDDDDGGSGARSGVLKSGDIEFEVEFKGAEKVTGEVRRAGEVAQAPQGSEWWGFEVTVKNPSKNYGANTPDMGVACNGESADATQVVENPGFIMGKPPYATGMLDAGASNTGVIPLAVPSDAKDCRLVVKMDSIHGTTTPLEFAFDK